MKTNLLLYYQEVIQMKNQRRMRFATVAAVVAILGMSLAPVALRADEPYPKGNDPVKQEPLVAGLDYAPHQLVVRSSHASSDMSYLGLESVQSVRRVMSGAPVYLIELDPSANVPAVAAQVSATPSVVYAHPNYLLNVAYSIQGSYPFPDQNVTGSMETQYSAGMMGLNSAHTLATGSGTTVAVIDCGVDFVHPKLGGQAISGWDFVDADAVAFDEIDGKISGHGTFVAGIIHLVAPQATIRSYRVMNQNGYGDGFTVAQAIERAVDDGCDVINLSLALTSRHLAVRDAIDYAVAHGVTVVAGAGNSGTDEATYPAAEPNALSVGAVDSLMQVASFSNIGTSVDILAPGENIYSSYLTSGFAWWSGTSFSTPFASGLSALLKQQEPSASTLRVRQRIFGGAIPIDSMNPAMNGKLGKGLLNPVASLNYTAAPDSATFIPDTLSLTYYIGQLNVYPPTVTGLLISTKDPSPFVATVIDTGVGLFVWVDDTAGSSGDSVRIYTHPERFMAGVYYNTIAFSVIGVPDPAYATVCLTVLGSQPPQSDAWLTPADLYITAPHSQMTPVSTGSVLHSQNAPAAFTATQRPEVSHAVRIVDTTGFTDDSVRLYFSPSEFLSPGSYDDTIFYTVAGILNPVALAIHITLTSDTTTGATAWFGAEPTWYSQPNGTWTTRALSVYSAIDSSNFVAYLSGAPSCIRLKDSAGVTPGAVQVTYDARGVNPGFYQAELYVNVNGAAPIHTTVSMTVTPGYPDSAWILPNTKQFTAPGGVPTITQDAFSVGTTGSPKTCIAALRDWKDFVRVIDSVSTAPGQVRFAIEPTTTAPGTYVDTIAVYIFNTNNTPLFFVAYLTIDNTGGGTVEISPNPLAVTVPPATYDTLLRQVMVTFPGASRPFTSIINGGSFRFVYPPDSGGMTNDSFDLKILPVGKPAGVYTNQVYFHVSGVAGYTTLTVNLTVSASGAETVSTDLMNFPNPFNPSTTISFTLPNAGHAALDVYDLLGRHVITLFDESVSAGEHLVLWDGKDRYGASVASGIYFYRLTTDDRSISKKMLLLK